jgi:hypothetical protein
MENRITPFPPMNTQVFKEKYEFDTVPTFPLELMPAKVALVAKKLNENAGFNIDYTVSSMIYAAAIGMGNTYNVKMSAEWYLAPIIYIALVGGPGVGKTHPLSFAVKPLRDADKSNFDMYTMEKAMYETDAALPKSHPEKLNLPKPKYRTYLLSDYTPEALASVHNDNPRGVGVKVDELAGWFGNFNRYNKGSEQEKWLSMWSGESIKIDRKGSEPIYIPHPFICVGGTIQPAVLFKLAAENRNENGFIDRILFVAPEIKKEPWRDSNEDGIASMVWSEIMLKLLSLTPALDSKGDPIPQTVSFDPEAKSLLFQWQKANTDRCNEDNDYALIGAKMDIYAIRLSLIIHALRYASEGSPLGVLSVEDVTTSIALVEYFTSMALRVKRALKGDSLAMESTDKKDLYNSLPDQFETAAGLKIALQKGVPIRTAKRFFSESGAFRRIKRGLYAKSLE